MDYERGQWRLPEDIANQNLGFDVRSTDPETDARRYIEVKARAGQGGVSLTQNEWFKARRFGIDYYLYVVLNAASKPSLYIIQDPAEALRPEEYVEVRYLVGINEILSIPRPFNSEAEFEKYIFDNQDLLGDVFIIHRQIRTGSRQGIPDMLGVDQDARVCIIEMKNHEVGEDILPQVFGYAIWAETNPDSIKAIWLESQDKPEDIEIDWDGFEVRVIIIAPAFTPHVPTMVSKILYPIDLIQVRRFGFESEEFLMVDFVEAKAVPRPVATRVLGEWDWDYYEKEHGKTATAQFRNAVSAIEGIVKKHGWDLSVKLTKTYAPFKLGNRNAFAVLWREAHWWAVNILLPEDPKDEFSGKYWEYQRYKQHRKYAYFRPVDPETIEISELEPLFVKAYRYLVSGIA